MRKVVFQVQVINHLKRHIISEANESFSIYKINEHQHIPEIEQAIIMFAGVETKISFNTHLVPMTRGILATSYAQVTAWRNTTTINRLFTRNI